MGLRTSGGAIANVTANSKDWSQISNRAVAKIPSSGYGAIERNAVADVTPKHTSASKLYRGRRGFPDYSIRNGEKASERHHSRTKRAVPKASASASNESYVLSLSPTWLAVSGSAVVDAHFFQFPTNGQRAFGVSGLYGCTSVIIVSSEGVYLSHIYEDPAFVMRYAGEWIDSDDDTFMNEVLVPLFIGDEAAQGLTGLIGTDQNPGPLHKSNSPAIFIVTPSPDVYNRTIPWDFSRLLHEDRIRELAEHLKEMYPDYSSAEPWIGTYWNLESASALQLDKINGKAFLEVDTTSSWYLSDPRPSHSGLTEGQWRLWVEDRWISGGSFQKRHPYAGFGRCDSIDSLVDKPSSSLPYDPAYDTPLEPSSVASTPSESEPDELVTPPGPLCCGWQFFRRKVRKCVRWCDRVTDRVLEMVADPSLPSDILHPA